MRQCDIELINAQVTIRVDHIYLSTLLCNFDVRKGKISTTREITKLEGVGDVETREKMPHIIYITTL